MKKKLKSKGFAAGVEREEVQAGVDLLQVDLGTHIQFVIDAMIEISAPLGFENNASESSD